MKLFDKKHLLNAILIEIKIALKKLNNDVWKYKFKENETHYYLSYYSNDKCNGHWRRCIVAKNNNVDYLIWLFYNCLLDINSKNDYL